MKKFISKFLPIKIFGRNGDRAVDVIFDPVSNIHRLCVDQVVKVESLRGFSDISDNWFFINSIGNAGDTLTLEIDSSDGVLDSQGYSVYTKTFTVLAGEDRQDLTDRITNELNADSNFLPVYRATRVKDSTIVIIKSRFFGEWGEVTLTPHGLPTPNTFRIIPTGGVNAYPAFDDFIRRNKLNSVSTDPRDERYGQLGVTGNVQIGGSVGNFFQEYFVDDQASNNMSIADNQVPKTFKVPIDLTKDTEIYEIRIFFTGNGINLGSSFGSGQALNNGIILRFKSDNEIKELGPFKTNSELKNIWSVGSPTNFRLDKPSGKDELLAAFRPGPPILLRKSGTFGDIINNDFLEIIIQDRTDNITEEMKAAAVGFKTDF